MSFASPAESAFARPNICNWSRRQVMFSISGYSRLYSDTDAFLRVSPTTKLILQHLDCLLLWQIIIIQIILGS